MHTLRPYALCLAILLFAGAITAAAEFAVLTAQTWEAFAPHGKEVDAIYGDYVLRNDKIVAVVAQPLATRNANMAACKTHIPNAAMESRGYLKCGAASRAKCSPAAQAKEQH